MATKFAKGQEVKVKAVIPAGPVEALRMDEDGNFFYQVKWVDENGVSQTRWFEESELVDG
jgi:uncharacterized protein YodC (DUF2158 family)